MNTYSINYYCYKHKKYMQEFTEAESPEKAREIVKNKVGECEIIGHRVVFRNEKE